MNIYLRFEKGRYKNRIRLSFTITFLSISNRFIFPLTPENHIYARAFRVRIKIMAEYSNKEKRNNASEHSVVTNDVECNQLTCKSRVIRIGLVFGLTFKLTDPRKKK